MKYNENLAKMLESDYLGTDKCFRTKIDDGDDPWQCWNDHTGCMWNDSNNGCMHEGETMFPLEDDLQEQWESE